MLLKVTKTTKKVMLLKVMFFKVTKTTKKREILISV